MLVWNETKQIRFIPFSLAMTMEIMSVAKHEMLSIWRKSRQSLISILQILSFVNVMSIVLPNKLRFMCIYTSIT